MRTFIVPSLCFPLAVASPRCHRGAFFVTEAQNVSLLRQMVIFFFFSPKMELKQ